MKITKYFNWILVGLLLFLTIKPVQIEGLANDDDSIKLPGSKRPFCNAFTGCGKKRNYADNEDDITRNNINDSMINIPLKLYQILINSLNSKMRKNFEHKYLINNNNNNYNDDDYYGSIHKNIKL